LKTRQKGKQVIALERDIFSSAISVSTKRGPQAVNSGRLKRPACWAAFLEAASADNVAGRLWRGAMSTRFAQGSQACEAMASKRDTASLQRDACALQHESG